MPEISPERLMQFTFDFAPPLMIETAIRYGVFDILDKGAKTLDILCAETSTSPRGLRTVLNALVGLDVLAKDEAGRYALTEESATFLVSGKPTYHGAFFLPTREPMLSSWGKLHDVVKSGRPTHHINREQEGTSFFLRFVEDIFPIHYAGAQFLDLPNVIASPNNSAQGTGAHNISLRRAVENCRRALTGEAPHHVIGLDEQLM
jgi:hypothetical protein